jgi:hypothetical protein
MKDSTGRVKVQRWLLDIFEKEMERLEPSSVAYFEQLLTENLPEFTDKLKEHKKDHDTILSHVLIYDLVLFTEELAETNQDEILKRVLNIIDKLLVYNAFTDNLVYVSFLENLDFTSEYYKKLKTLFSPRLLAAAEEMRKSLGYT